MPRSAVMSHPVTPTTRANTRSKKIKRDPPPTTGAAATSTEDSPSATVSATVSFATPDRADGVTAGVVGDEATSASSGAGAVAGGTTTSTRTRSGRSLSTEPLGKSTKNRVSDEKDMATPVAAPTPKTAATVTPPDDKANNGPPSSGVFGAGPTITEQEQPPVVAPDSAGGSTSATTKAASPPTFDAKEANVVDPNEPHLSPGAKRFGLRKRKSKSPSPVAADDASHATTTSSSRDQQAPRSPRPSPAAAAAAAAAAAVSSTAVTSGSTTSSRNVTFSPVPPQQHHYAGGSTAASGASGGAKPLPTLHEGEMSATSTVSVPSNSSDGGKKKTGGGGKSAAGIKSSSKDKGGETGKERGGRATPTNFATDFGKSINSPSFQTGEGVFSWLQSPTGMFSPGGYVASAVNTPREYYGAGPRTPRTPSDRAGFFFSDVAGLPSGAEGYSPRISGRRQPQHPLSNLICVSPLATNKSKPGTPINYKNIFDSPHGRHATAGAGGRAAPYMGSRSGKKGKKSADATTLEAVHMAERDLMEDEDLSVLLQLASAATPRGHPAHTRYGQMAGEAPSNLQLPVIGKGGPAHAGGSPSKLVARKDALGSAARHTGQPRHAEHFRPPALPSGSGPGEKGSASLTKMSTNGKKKTPSPTAGESGSRPVGPGGEYMHGYHPYHPGAHPAFMGHHPMGPPAGWKPGAGPPPPHARGPPPYGAPPPPGSGSKEKGSSAPHRPMYHPNFPPHMAYHMMHFPPQPNARHPMNAAAYGSPPKPKEGSSPKSKGNGSGKGSGAYSPTASSPSRSSPKAAAKSKEKSKSATVTATKRKSASGSQPTHTSTKKSKPSSPKKKSKSARKTGGQASSTGGNGGGSTNSADRQKSTKSAAAITAIAGGKNKEAAALAAAILRGVTMRPSGKWQAQMYFAGKSRYIGVFDTREKAALAYEIARAKLQKAKANNSNTEDAVNEARRAAFDGVNEKDPRRK